ncbi:hypothetical protein DL98DRAFT_514246 [Cadophora sp. DSE1049]|nr:hypothetical protein DL98DRAFT_514246 [Cadophora sp. DSE1049]
MKYVLVSGGVISGVGKGIIVSSTGLLLKTKGLKVTMIKIDPYMNIDAGTMAPTEHGECFVLEDGGETDLDLGNYERYLNITLSRNHNITTGKIYQHVIDRERRGDYLGKTVQIVPHLTDALQDWFVRVAHVPVDETKVEPDVCVIELGGTVGDIENAPFVEALRQLRRKAGLASKDTSDGLIIHERHRHRYEVNPAYVSRLASHGLSFVGKDDQGERMEVLELEDHPWFVGVQFHPEYLSKVLEPSRPYLGFFAASAGCLKEVMEKLESGKAGGEKLGEALEEANI